MTDKIIAALKSLDPTNDNHWTNDGAPRLETVRLLSANPGLSRESVNNALPGFSRAVASGAANPETKPEPTAEELAAAAAAAEAAKGTSGPETPAPTPAPTPADATAPETPATTSDEDQFGNLLGEPLAEQGLNQDSTLQEILDDANEYLSKLLDARERLNEEITKTQNDVARAQAACDEEIKSGHTLSPIQAYLASQVKIGQERGELRRTVEQSGVDLKELSLRLSPSPIDSALGNRKRQPRNISGA